MVKKLRHAFFQINVILYHLEGQYLVQDRHANFLSCVSTFVNKWLTGLPWVYSVFQVFLGKMVQPGQNMVKTIQYHSLFPKV